MYEWAAQILIQMRKRVPLCSLPMKAMKPGSFVLTMNHKTRSLDQTYIEDYRVIFKKGNQLEVKSTTDKKIKMVHISDTKYLLPVDRLISKIPDCQMLVDRQTLG